MSAPAPRSNPSSAPWTGALCGLGAALLFGASAPLAKRLLGEVHPVMLAALLYFGAAGALGIAAAVRRRAAREAALGAAGVPLLAVIVLTGGVLGPVLMLLGLQRVSGGERMRT